MIRRFGEIEAGGKLSAAELNRLFAEVERLVRLQVAAPLDLTYDGAGVKLRLSKPLPELVTCRVTGAGVTLGAVAAWPAVTRKFDRVSGWADKFSGPDLWVIRPDTASLSTDDIVEAVKIGDIVLSGDGRPLYVAVKPGTGAGPDSPDCGGSATTAPTFTGTDCADGLVHTYTLKGWANGYPVEFCVTDVPGAPADCCETTLTFTPGDGALIDGGNSPVTKGNGDTVTFAVNPLHAQVFGA